jgi:hypothetical protein
MPQSVKWSQFSAGWCPSDDAVKGRPNALFQMDNLELDNNGALQLCSGVHDQGIAYERSYPAIRINNRKIGGTNYTYAVQSNGVVLRDNTSIARGEQTVTGATLAPNAVLTVSGSTNGYSVGDTIDLHGFGDAGWNGTRTILLLTTTTVTIALDSTALAFTGAGTPKFSSNITTARAAFGSAFDYELICIGNHRYKDNGTTLSNLGVGAPTVAITFGGTPITLNNMPALGTVSGAGTGAGHIYNGDGYAPPGVAGVTPQCDWAATVIGAVPAIDLINKNGFPICDIQSYNLPNQPVDWSVMPDGTPFADTDYMDITLSGWTTNKFKQMTLDFLLVAPATTTYGHTPNTWTGAPPVTDYYRATVNYSDLTITIGGGGVQTGTLRLRRSAFKRIGNGTQTWSSVYGWKIIEIPDTTPVGDLHIQICGPGDTTYAGGFTFYKDVTLTGGTLNGYYQYAQQNGNLGPSYLALSELGPVSATIHAASVTVNYIFQDPTGVDPQVNTVYIYRRNAVDSAVTVNPGLLDQWYRVATQTKVNGAWITQQSDSISDQVALTLNQTINTNLISVSNQIRLPDPILDIVGPIEGRWFYFTSNFMYPSEINDPDLVDVSLGVRTAGASETFYWARQVSDAIVLVGTSNDIYILTGTFRTLPDYTVDIYYHGLGCKFPPVASCADVYSSVVFYLSSDGWRSYNATGNNPYMVSGSQIMPYGTNPLWVSPNIDALYRGETKYGYSPIDYTSKYHNITIAKNKMWCAVVCADGFTRIDVYDFIRQYWRPYRPIASRVISAMTMGISGGILGAVWNPGVTAELYELDYDGASDTPLTISALFHIEDGETPRQRKDSETLKLRCFSNGDTINAFISTDAYTLVGLAAFNVTGTSVVDKAIDISAAVGICKTYQLSIIGTFTRFQLDDAEILFDLRPQQITFIRLLSTNYGASAPKRVYTVPFVADFLGHTLTFTPIVDGVSKTPVTFTGTGKRTYQFDFGEITPPGEDVLRGTDYEYTIGHPTGNDLFEFFGMLEVKTLEVYPDTQVALWIPPTNFGIPNKKRVRVWPFVIDTWSTPSVFTPIVDGTVLTSLQQTFTTTDKYTVFVQYTEDVFGVDYGGFWSGTPFSMFKAENPDIVQVLPIARRFDQVGPEELFRWGRIKQFELRVLPFGVAIPYTLYINDNSRIAGTITTVSGVEKSYFIGVPKGTNGEIVRIELGPTEFDFHRFYMRLQVFKTGRDTDLEWVTLPVPQVPNGQ